MGYLFTTVILFASAGGLLALYEIAPTLVRNEINEFIDQIGGEA